MTLRAGLILAEPSKTNHFGSAFEDLFDRLKKQGFPVFGYGTLENPDKGVRGAVATISPFSENAKAFYFLNLKWASNAIHAHEEQHIRDFVSHSEEFLRTLPRLPDNIHDSIEQLKDGLHSMVMMHKSFAMQSDSCIPSRKLVPMSRH